MLQARDIGESQVELLRTVFLGKFQNFFRTHPSSMGGFCTRELVYMGYPARLSLSQIEIRVAECGGWVKSGFVYGVHKGYAGMGLAASDAGRVAGRKWVRFPTAWELFAFVLLWLAAENGFVWYFRPG